jgi:predicted dehydrogenase
MIAKDKIRFGLIGAGAIARAYVQAFQDCEDAVLAGVADVRAEAAAELAAPLEVPSFTSHEAMCDAVEIDAAIICTPPVTHHNLVLDLVGRGVAVLCEKPLTITVPSAHKMIAAAREENVLLSMASKFRFVDDVRRAREIVASGMLGEILLYENAFTSHVDMRNRWNSNRAISGGGVLIDNGTHSVDIMRYFLGPLVNLQVIEGRRVQGLDVEETVRLFLRTADNVMGQIDLSWSMNKEQAHYIGIYGSQGTVLVGWQESKYRIGHAGPWIVFGHGYQKVQAFRRQIENFAKALRGEELLAVAPADALASVEVITAAYAALERSQWQAIQKPLPANSVSSVAAE